MILSREPTKFPTLVMYLVESTMLAERFGVLPKAGGLLDQDAGWVSGMQMVLTAMAEKAEMEQRKKKR